MFKSYVLIAIVGIIIIAYIGIALPLGATTGMSISFPIIDLSDGTNGIVDQITEPAETEDGVTSIYGISDLKCLEFTFEEPLELAIADDESAFNILRILIPSCETSEINGCLDPELNAQGAIEHGIFEFREIELQNAIKLDAWVIGNTWALDADGNIYSCVLFELPISEEPEVPEENQTEETEELAPVPNIVVSDQQLIGDQILVDAFYLDQPGYVVVHADENGEPGPVIGQTNLWEGFVQNLLVNINSTQAGDTVHVMLHYDNGDMEFGEGDEPVIVDNETVVGIIEFI